MRRRPLRAHRAGDGRWLLPLHSLPAPHWDRFLSAGPDRRPDVPITAGGGTGEGLAPFCRECGAHLFSRNPDDPTQMSVRMGAFDGDPGVRPSWRTYVAYAAEWEPIPDDGLECFEEGKPRF